jgi:hypothetical protein
MRRTRLFGAAVALAVAGALGALGGCTSARNTLGTSSSPCFRAVPVASEAVNDRGTLAGIRLVGQKEIDSRRRLRELVQGVAGPAVHNVCVVSFHGQFRLDQVKKPFGTAPPGGSGPVALVVVSTPQNQLLGTLVVTHEPLPLRHNVLGPLPSRASPTSGPALLS